MLRALSIVALCIAAAVVYGLIHDQITIRVSPEYFTVLHPQVLPADTPLTLLALVWGVIATWWVGLILGVVLAGASCLGKRPKLSAGMLVKPVAWLLVVMGGCAAVSGVVGYFLAIKWIVVLNLLPHDREVRAIAAWFTHLASYGVGILGGLVVAVRAYIRRGRMASH